MQYLKIPEERIPVLIGGKGCVKKQIEEDTKTKIGIEETSVSIESSTTGCLGELLAKNMVLAIGRGFNPEIAFKLTNEDYTIEILPLTDFVESPKAFERIKGRVIGERGRSRKLIEELSGAYIAVYGKTIGILGSFDDVALAKDAVIMLIEGARHSTVYKMLEKAQAGRRTVMAPWSGETAQRERNE